MKFFIRISTSSLLFLLLICTQVVIAQTFRGGIAGIVRRAAKTRFV